MFSERKAAVIQSASEESIGVCTFHRLFTPFRVTGMLTVILSVSEESI